MRGLLSWRELQSLGWKLLEGLFSGCGQAFFGGTESFSDRIATCPYIEIPGLGHGRTICSGFLFSQQPLQLLLAKRWAPSTSVKVQSEVGINRMMVGFPPHRHKILHFVKKIEMFGEDLRKHIPDSTVHHNAILHAVSGLLMKHDFRIAFDILTPIANHFVENLAADA